MGGIIRGERCDGRTRVTLDGDPLPWGVEVVPHFPTGLEWGYHGSGPAQLALAILLAVTAVWQHPPQNRPDSLRTPGASTVPPSSAALRPSG